MGRDIDGIDDGDLKLLLKDAKKGLNDEELDKENKVWDDVEFDERQRMRSQIFESIRRGHPVELRRYKLVEKEEDAEKNEDRMREICRLAYKRIYRRIGYNKVGQSLH